MYIYPQVVMSRVKSSLLILFAAGAAACTTLPPEKASAPPESTAAPAVAAVTKNNQPNRLVMTIKGNPQTGRAWHWFTSDPVPKPVLLISAHPDMSAARVIAARSRRVQSQYMPRDKDGWFIYQKLNKRGQISTYFTDAGQKNPRREPWQEARKGEKVTIGLIPVTETVYDAEATGLKAATVYYYQVGSEQSGFSPVGKFKTAGSADTPFTFLHYTDTQPAFWNEHTRNEAQFAADTLAQAIKTAPDAGFILHTGDITEVAAVEDGWVDLMRRSQHGLANLTLVPAPGNHDEYGLKGGKLGPYDGDLLPYKFTDHFNLKAAGKIDGGAYYSFDYHNAHFVILNSNDTKNPGHKTLGKEQLAWAKRDVKAARRRGAQWIIFASHKSLFSKSYHSLQDPEINNVREEWMQLLTDLKVDLALAGHDHVYSRTKPLRYVPATQSFVNAEVAPPATYTTAADGSNIIRSPQGTVFIVADTGGTKIYDTIFDLPLAQIIKVRPHLQGLTPENLNSYRKLFAAGVQPERALEFKNRHENDREGSTQTFIVYNIDGKKLSAKVYTVKGNLARREKRHISLLDEFSIEK